MSQIFIGPLVHTLDPTTIQYSSLSIVGVSSSGIIDFIAHDVPRESLEDTLETLLSDEEILKKGWSKDGHITKKVLVHGEFLCPGFIDTHTHG